VKNAQRLDHCDLPRRLAALHHMIASIIGRRQGTHFQPSSCCRCLAASSWASDLGISRTAASFSWDDPRIKRHAAGSEQHGRGVRGWQRRPWSCFVWMASRVSHAQRSMPSVAQAAGLVRLLSEPPMVAYEGISPGAAAGKNLKHAQLPEVPARMGEPESMAISAGSRVGQVTTKRTWAESCS
jgi:hypothetical protein